MALIGSFLGDDGPKSYSSNLDKLCYLLRKKLRDSPDTQGKIQFSKLTTFTNSKQGSNFILEIVYYTCLLIYIVIWMTTPPISTEINGALIVQQIEGENFAQIL